MKTDKLKSGDIIQMDSGALWRVRRVTAEPHALIEEVEPSSIIVKGDNLNHARAIAVLDLNDGVWESISKLEPTDG